MVLDEADKTKNRIDVPCVAAALRICPISLAAFNNAD